MSKSHEFLDTIIAGDVRETISQLPPKFANCIVTSPPYFGHRCYSSNDIREIGRERSVEEYVARLVDVFEKLRSVLRDDGTLWLNVGDTFRDGELLGVPWRLAFALKDSGWHMRADIIWHKPNAMPTSVTSRPTIDHEYIFFFSKEKRYYYDADAIREAHVTFSPMSKMKGGRNHFGKRNGTPERGKNAGNANLHKARWDQAFHPDGRNKRTVWTVPLGKCRETHFAVFPEQLIEPCVKAGCPRSGVVIDPFLGSGTTAMVARRLRRNFVGFELVPEYVQLATKRLLTLDIVPSLFD